jgi:hypothetical protein
MTVDVRLANSALLTIQSTKSPALPTAFLPVSSLAGSFTCEGRQYPGVVVEHSPASPACRLSARLPLLVSASLALGKPGVSAALFIMFGSFMVTVQSMMDQSDGINAVHAERFLQTSWPEECITNVEMYSFPENCAASIDVDAPSIRSGLRQALRFNETVFNDDST